MSLKQPVTNDQRELVKAKLTDIDAVKELTVNQNKICVVYDFPATTIEEILTMLLLALDKNRLSLFQKLYYSILAYMEENERTHLSKPLGWEHDIKYIYAYYFDRQQKSKQASHKKQWQKYSNKK